MGCGASSKKYAAGAEPAAAAPAPAPAPDETAPPATTAAPAETAPPAATAAAQAEPPPAAVAASSQPAAAGELAPAAPPADVEMKRRPSQDGGAKKPVTGHEGNTLGKDDEKTALKRVSVVRTEMELWFMDGVPQLYGRTESDALRDELREETQAEIVNRCVVATPEEAERILNEWLHDCDPAQRAEFIAKAQNSIQQISRKRQQSQLPTLEAVDENAPKPEKKGAKKDMQLQFAVEDDGPDSPTGEKKAKGPMRRGTGCVTAAELRALMTNDQDEDDDEEESDEDEKDDEEFERRMNARNSASHPKERIAVCAETTEIDPDWVAPVYPKTKEQQARLSDAVSNSFMFAALGEAELNTVIAAFQEVTVEPGVTVITQGAEVGPAEHGLYVLESGRLDVFKNGEGPVFTYTQMGQYFGDLALLYNAPRSATVVATEPSILWSIDRNTFNGLVKDAIRKAKQRRVAFLQSVELLKSLDPDEIAKLADVLRERIFGDGVPIIREGEEGHEFFILEKGKAAARKGGDKIKEFTSSDYFGELALLNDAPRACDVVTTEHCTVLSLDRMAFQRLLGNLGDLMRERAATSYGPNAGP